MELLHHKTKFQIVAFSSKITQFLILLKRTKLWKLFIVGGSRPPHRIV